MFWYTCLLAFSLRYKTINIAQVIKKSCELSENEDYFLYICWLVLNM